MKKICIIQAILLVIAVGIMFVGYRQLKTQEEMEQYHDEATEFYDGFIESFGSFENLEDLMEIMVWLNDKAVDYFKTTEYGSFRAYVEQTYTEEWAAMEALQEKLIKEGIIEEIVPLIVTYCFYKSEPDGDYEIFYQEQDIWYYKQKLGGQIVELTTYGSVTENYIRELISDRIEEFEYKPYSIAHTGE